MNELTHRLDVVNVNDELRLYNIKSDSGSRKPFLVDLKVNNEVMTFQIDSGTCVSCISDKLYLEKFRNCKLEESYKLLYLYNGEKVKPLGVLNVQVEYKGLVNNLKLYVLKNGGPPIVG